MTIYRLHRAKYRTADATGAMLAGGRWNPIGIPMLYAAEHLSMACLEVLVHLDKTQLPRDYVWSKAELRERPSRLHDCAPSSTTACQISGAEWIRESGALAVLVPSAVIPDEESNVLLNPAHLAFGSLAWSEPRPFRFDQRLFLAAPEPL